MKNKYILGYRNAIWFFSFLLLVLFIVFGLGAIANIHRLVRIWQYREETQFANISHSITNIIAFMVTDSKGVNKKFSESLITSLKRSLNGFESIDELSVFIMTNEEILPLLHVNDFEKFTLDDFKNADCYSFWSKGWRKPFGIRLHYKNILGENSNAHIFPLPLGSKNPDVLIIVEKNLSYRNAINSIVEFLDIYLMTGIVGVCLIVIFYGRKVLKPFSMLEKILESASRVIPENEMLYKDPVQRAIEMFRFTLAELKTKQKQLENLNEQLEEKSKQMDEFRDKLISSVDSGIITFDKKRRLIFMTSKIPNLLGLNLETSIGKTCEELFGTGGVICSLLTDGLKYGRLYKRRQWKWEMPGNRVVWLSTSTTLLTSKNDMISGVGFIFRDITESKRLEEQIREKQHLAALGELSAGIAHELRNPLGVIRGNADLLESEISRNDLKEMIWEIKNEISNLDRIIRDFLKFARPTKLSITMVDIIKLLSDIIESYHNRSNISFILQVKKNIQGIFAEVDDNLIRQVMTILLDNAVESVESMEGTGKIDVWVDSIIKKYRSKSDKFIGIHVSDNGPGIAVDDIDKIFKPFFTRKSQGTGLGLAIAKKLVLLHNGYLEYIHQKTGAHFVVLIPQKYDPDRTVDLNF